MERKHDQINLRTDLPNSVINEKLRNWTCQNFTEILNKPKKQKNNISISNLANWSWSKIRRNSSSLWSKTTFTTEINYNKFNESDIFLTESSPRETQSKKSFKSWIDQNYTDYIKNLRHMYPDFKFNHYSKYSEKVKNTNSNKETSANTSSVEEYLPTEIIETLALGKEFQDNPNCYRIKRETLERKNVDEICMILHDYEIKVSIIENSLNKILSFNSGLIYNYIEENMNINHQVDKSIFALHNKKGRKDKLIHKYVINSSKIWVQGNKRETAAELCLYLKWINELHTEFMNLKSISQNCANGMKIKELSESWGKVKNTIFKIRGYDKLRKLKIVNQIEKELMTFENKSEEKLMEQFTMSVRKLFNWCIEINATNTSIIDQVPKEENQKERKGTPTKYDWTFDKDDKYIENNFVCFNTSKTMNISFYLIYDSKSVSARYASISALINNWWEIIDIIIKDNADISLIIERWERVFKSFIISTYDTVQKQSAGFTNVEIIKILSNGFIIILSNYHYLINLFNINFGLLPRIFTNWTSYISNEMNKLLKTLIQSPLLVTMINGDAEEFLAVSKEVYLNCIDYINYKKLNWYEYTEIIYTEFITSFYEIEKEKIMNEWNTEDWVHYNKIDIWYQEMFGWLCNTNTALINPEQLSVWKEKLSLINHITQNSTENNVEFITFDIDTPAGSQVKIKHKIVKFTLTCIKFIFKSFYLFNSITDKNIRSQILSSLYSTSTGILSKGVDIIIHTQTGKIITEKEICWFSSHCSVFRHCILSAWSIQPNESIVKVFNESRALCKDGMMQWLSNLSDALINELSALDFGNYPVLGDKQYNNYIKKYTRMIKVYDNMWNAFNTEDIVELFNAVFKNWFDSMEKVVFSKCKIESDGQWKQFRTEMNYVKKILKKVDVVNTDVFKDKVDSMSKFVNPTKGAKKKKAKEGKGNKEKTEDQKE